MDSKTIRYNNTRTLVEQVGGVSNFANKINKGQSQTSQFAGTSPIKGIGNKVAREIEEAFGKPHGWLDIPHYEILDSAKSQNEISLSKDLKIIINQLVKLESQEKLTPQLITAIKAIIATVEISS